MMIGDDTIYTLLVHRVLRQHTGLLIETIEGQSGLITALQDFHGNALLRRNGPKFLQIVPPHLDHGLAINRGL